MNKPILPVDFNEMLESDLVLLSADATKIDSSGKSVALYEGLKVVVVMRDTDANGSVDNLVAHGVVERNTLAISWADHVKWCCRIDSHGVRHESEL